MMQKIYAGLMVLMISFTSTVSAKTIDFIVPSKAGSIFPEFATIIKPYLEAEGFEVNIMLTGNCGKGYPMFERSKDPTLMLVSNQLISTEECPLALNGQTMISSLLSGNVAVCANPDVKDPVGAILNRRTATIGLGGGDWPKAVFADLNPNFKIVVYSSSGELAKGFAAGDTEFIATNMLRADGLMQAGKANCVATTAGSVVKGIAPAHQVFPDWHFGKGLKQIFSVAGNNFTAAQRDSVKKTLDRLVQSEAWKTIAARGAFEIDPNITADTVIATSKIWASK